MAVKDKIDNVLIYEWCSVDIHNEFNFMNKSFVIDDNVSEYKVFKKAGDINNYTNMAQMDRVLVVLKNNYELKFYNQNYQLIENNFIKIKT